MDPSHEIPTVLTVSWEAGDGATGAHVDFGQGGDLGNRAPASDRGDGWWEATLVGLKPSGEVELRAVEATGDGSRESELTTAETGPRPGSVPEIVVQPGGDGALASDGFLVTSFVPGPAAIVDRDGEVVWWHQLDVDYDHSITRALPLPDGRGVLYLLWTNLHHGGPESWMRQLVQVSFDGQEVVTTELTGAHHDFALLPDGTVAALMYDTREVGGIAVAADRLVEVAPDGSMRQIWTVWDHVEFDPDEEYEGGERWGHCNAVDHDPVDEVYLVSCRNFSAIFGIDRATGEVLWQLGKDGDFALADGGTWFENEHQFQIDRDGALVFDNADAGAATSAVREYTLDHDAWAAEEIWSFEPDPALGVYAFGDVSRLPGGNTLIAWGSSGQIDEVTSTGVVVRRMEIQLGAGVGYVVWTESLYPDD